MSLHDGGEATESCRGAPHLRDEGKQDSSSVFQSLSAFFSKALKGMKH